MKRKTRTVVRGKLGKAVEELKGKMVVAAACDPAEGRCDVLDPAR